MAAVDAEAGVDADAEAGSEETAEETALDAEATDVSEMTV